MSDSNFILRARGIFLFKEKLLLVKHGASLDYYALPGGKIDAGETPLETIKREIIEEFGIDPEIGRLLYINTYKGKRDDFQTVEFFFEILNSKDYLDTSKLGGTHKFELFDIRWVGKDENIKILPEFIQTDFKNNDLLADAPKFTK